MMAMTKVLTSDKDEDDEDDDDDDDRRKQQELGSAALSNAGRRTKGESFFVYC
jgi:hypothetical protein